MSHTPTPWHKSGRMIFAPGEKGGNICELSELRASEFVKHRPIAVGSDDRNEAHANGEFIVRAANSHEELLEACKELVWAMEIDGTTFLSELEQRIIERGRSALAKAEGRE